MTSNRSLEPTPTSMSLGPLPGLGHHPSSGPSAMPACAAQLERYASGFGQHRELHLAGLRPNHRRSARPAYLAIEQSVAARHVHFSCPEAQ